MDNELQKKLDVSNNVILQPLTFKDNTASTGIERNVSLLKTSYDEGIKLGVVLDMNNNEIKNVSDAHLNSNCPNLGQVKDLLNLKLNLTGGTLSGDLNLGNNKITNVSDPTSLKDCTNKEYVDEQDSFRVSKQGDSMTGQLSMSNNKITNLANPSDGTDATNKNYVDTGLNTKLNSSGGLMTGTLNMFGSRILGLNLPTDVSEAVSKEYVDAIDVNPNVYEYTTFGNDSLVEIDFTSTFSTANPINVKVEYLAVSTDGSPFLLKKIGSYSFRTYTSANFADYRTPDYYIGNAGDDFIGCRWDTTGDPDKLKIYLKSISPTDSIKGRVKITILDEGYQMGQGRIIDLGVRDTVITPIPDDRLLINKEYVDNTITDITNDLVSKTEENTLTGINNFNGQTNFFANTVYNNKNIVFQTGGNIFMNELGYILGVKDPVADNHAANKRYVDENSTYVEYREGFTSNVVCNSSLANRITLNDVILPIGNYICSANLTMRSDEDIDSMASCLISTSFGGSQTVSNRDGYRGGTSPIIKQHNFSFSFRVIVSGSGDQNIYPNFWFSKVKWPNNTNPSNNSDIEYSISFMKY